MEKGTKSDFTELALVDDGENDLVKKTDGDCSKKDDDQNKEDGSCNIGEEVEGFQSIDLSRKDKSENRSFSIKRESIVKSKMPDPVVGSESDFSQDSSTDSSNAESQSSDESKQIKKERRSRSFIESRESDAQLQQIRCLSHSMSETNLKSSCGARYRLEEDFQFESPVTVLGKGGFGDVLKCKHKLDWQDYAVKIIKLLKRKEDIEKGKSEARAHAKIYHENIVRYHACWTEEHTKDEQRDFETKLQISSSSNSKSSSSGSGLPSIPHQPESDNSSFAVDFVNPVSILKGDQSQMKNQLWKKVSEKSSGQSSQSTSQDDTGSEEQDPTSTLYLYIQMELCKETLKDWLVTNCTAADRVPGLCSKILHGIVDGLVYLHQSNLIHRDMKPSNIFFAFDGKIKIGDFGLTTYDMIPNDEERMEGSAQENEAERTDFVGTKSYMSPEQKSETTYDSQTDIFPLGLICFEVSYPMETGMEMQKSLSSARTSTFPENHPPKMCNFLKKLLEPLPEDRPTAKEVKALITEDDPFIPD